MIWHGDPTALHTLNINLTMTINSTLIASLGAALCLIVGSTGMWLAFDETLKNTLQDYFSTS